MKFYTIYPYFYRKFSEISSDIHSVLWLNNIKCNGCIYYFYVYRNDAVDEINDSRSGGKVVDEKKKKKKNMKG